MPTDQQVVHTRIEGKVFYGTPSEVEEQMNAWFPTIPQGSRVEGSPIMVVSKDVTPPLCIKEVTAVIPQRPPNGRVPDIIPARELPS